MKNVESKPQTLRSAKATATIYCPEFCIPLLKNRCTQKGDAIEAARVAANIAAKKTSDIIPLCHPLSLLAVDVDFTLNQACVDIEVEVRLIAQTGAEMEALTAASVAALTLYDMLKPHAGTDLAIENVRLLDKKGGKSHYKRFIEPGLKAALVTISDEVVAGEIKDQAAPPVIDELQKANINVDSHQTIANKADEINQALNQALAGPADLVITLGGTGLSAADQTYEIVKPLLDREIPGLMETARQHGQQRTPFAMLSRGVAGLVGDQLVITFPGTPQGAQETLDALLVGILEIFSGMRRDQNA